MNEKLECQYCKWARKAENKEYVGCAAALSGEGVNFFSFYNREQICTGWVNLRCYPGKEDEFGIITNGVPCFKPNDYCGHFELRGD